MNILFNLLARSEVDQELVNTFESSAISEQYLASLVIKVPWLGQVYLIQ